MLFPMGRRVQNALNIENRSRRTVRRAILVRDLDTRRQDNCRFGQKRPCPIQVSYKNGSNLVIYGRTWTFFRSKWVRIGWASHLRRSLDPKDRLKSRVRDGTFPNLFQISLNCSKLFLEQKGRYSGFPTLF